MNRPTHFSGAIAQGPGSVETVDADKILNAVEDNGKTLFLGADSGISITLPRPQAGLRFEFVIAVAPSVDYVITTHSGDNVMIGGINELEVDTGDDGPYSAGAGTLTFVAALAVVGDSVSMVCDGTSWYLTGQTHADGGITLSAT
jgi:hypothetical protein